MRFAVLPVSLVRETALAHLCTKDVVTSHAAIQQTERPGVSLHGNAPILARSASATNLEEQVVSVDD